MPTFTPVTTASTSSPRLPTTTRWCRSWWTAAPFQAKRRETTPKKNIITRALGTQSSVNIDYFKVALVPGDKLLLCSDGLSNMLEEQQICALLQKPDAAKAVDALIEASLDAGANDNVTAVLISR